MRRNQCFPFWVIISLMLLIFSASSIRYCHAWEWSDFVDGGDVEFRSRTLTMTEVSSMRVRDIKRRLSRSHGYSADELGVILDKKELIQMLSFEEHKERQKEQEKLKRFLLIRGAILSVVGIIVVACWPVLQHLWEVAMVNFVVYTDRKKHEVSRCLELRSVAGGIGVLAMAILDVLQAWLTISVMLSWFIRSRFFFPTPNLPVKPAQMMGGQMAKSKAANYGLNVGPMALTWGMRFVYGKTELWTGQALSRAHQKQRKAAREWESPEDRAARKAARKAARRAAKEEATQLREKMEAEETARRRQVADAATSQLFPPHMVHQYQQQQQQQQMKMQQHSSNGISEEGGIQEEGGEKDTSNNHANPGVSEQTRKEFQEQMKGLDMDELD